MRTHGPSFSIGPFTILSTSILPSSSTFVAPPTPMQSSPMATHATFTGYSPRMDTPGMMYDQTPRQSFDAAVCPPTPDSVASNQTPQLVTPHMTHPVYNNSNKSAGEYAYDASPSKMSSKINRYRLGATGNKPAYTDVEKGPEMFGLGMGEIGGDESQGVRP